MNDSSPAHRISVWATLLTSSTTLVCCALPIVFVTLGMGATVAAVTHAFPFLLTLSEHKTWVFGFAAVMLMLSGWLLYRPGRSCPAEPGLREACSLAQRWNRRVYWGSVVIWMIGFFAAYLALPLRLWLDI